MSWNTLFGGLDRGDGRRRELQIAVIREVDPDILLLQELKGFSAAGGELLYDTERRLGLRGLLAPAPATGQDTAVFVRPGIEILRFEADAEHFHHAAAVARLLVPGLDRPLTAVSVHLCPFGPHVRLREACYLADHAAPEGYALLGGDLNSVSPDDPEPEGLAALPPRFGVRYTDPEGRADRGTIGHLLRAGFADVAVRLDGGGTATVPGAAFAGAEFVPFRCDYLLASRALAELAGAYRVVRDARTDTASDHYPIVAEFRSTAD